MFDGDFEGDLVVGVAVGDLEGNWVVGAANEYTDGLFVELGTKEILGDSDGLLLGCVEGSLLG